MKTLQELPNGLNHQPFPVPFARTERHTQEHCMSATATVPFPTPVSVPVQLTIVLRPAHPASIIDPASSRDPQVPAPTGLRGWPEGEPTWEDAEWQ